MVLKLILGRYLPEELETKVKKTLGNSGHEGKSEFLEDMVNVYNTHLLNREEDISEEIVSYKHINTQSKEVLRKTFSHLLSTMDYNFSSVLQEKLFIEEEKKKLNEKSTLLDQELNRLKLKHIEERKVWEVEAKDEIRILVEEKEHLTRALDEERGLVKKSEEELVSLKVIAAQTSLVIEENKELRSSLSLLEKERKAEIIELTKKHKEDVVLSEEEVNALKLSLLQIEGSLRDEEKKLFEVSHTLGRCEEELLGVKEKGKSELDAFRLKEVEYISKGDNISSELMEVTSLYNQLLGKVEVLEKGKA